MTHDPGVQFDGPATLRAGGGDLAVTVSLRGMFQPLDGHFHWYGRVEPTAPDDLSGGAQLVVRTAHGEAVGRLSDRDPWGRWRISGTGTPPF